MRRCPNCGRDSRHEFCETCTEYVGLPGDEEPLLPDVPDLPDEQALPPAPVLPGAALPRPPLRRLGEAVPHDVRCGACGAYGPEGRTFCAICGEEVASRPPEPEPPPPPWWSRGLDWLRGLRRRPPVVTGPIGPLPVLREPSDVRWGLVALVAVPILVVAAVPVARGAYRALTVRYEPVRPASAFGTAIPRFHPPRIVDGIANTSWIGPLRSSRGVAVRVDFSGPVDLDRIGVTQGAGESPESYTKYQRVERLALVFDDGTTIFVGFADEPGFQSVRVKARDVRWVRMTVVSRYAGSDPRNGPALSEVEFFRLR